MDLIREGSKREDRNIRQRGQTPTRQQKITATTHSHLLSQHTQSMSRNPSRRATPHRRRISHGSKHPQLSSAECAKVSSHASARTALRRVRHSAQPTVCAVAPLHISDDRMTSCRALNRHPSAHELSVNSAYNFLTRAVPPPVPLATLAACAASAFQPSPDVSTARFRRASVFLPPALAPLLVELSTHLLAYCRRSLLHALSI